VGSSRGRETCVAGIGRCALFEWRTIRGSLPRQLYGGENVAIFEAETGNAALERYAASLSRKFRRVNNDRIQITGDEPYTIGFLRTDREWPTSRTDKATGPRTRCFGTRSADSDALAESHARGPTSSPVRSRGRHDGAGVEDALTLERAVMLLMGADDDAARAALHQLSHTDPLPRAETNARVAIHRPPRQPRTSVLRKLMATIFQRDGWRCHYCGRRLIASGVIELVGSLFPNEFPFPPGHNMPKSKTHPAAERVCPNVDHVQASALGGSALDLMNLITACTPCNEAKGDRLGWRRVELQCDDWDGLVGSYRALFTLAGSPTTEFHREWMKLLNV
jgi:HNH endonuclease